MAATGAFLVDLLAPVGRSERRHWGSVYVRGLLLDSEPKSEPMAKRRPDGNQQVMQQGRGTGNRCGSA